VCENTIYDVPQTDALALERRFAQRRAQLRLDVARYRAARHTFDRVHIGAWWLTR
jgi:hypothetical protein